MKTIAIKPKFIIASLMVFCAVLLARSANTDDLNLDTGNYEYPEWRSIGNFGSLALLAGSILVIKSEDENDEPEHDNSKKSSKTKVTKNSDRTVEREDRPISNSTDNSKVQSTVTTAEEQKNYLDDEIDDDETEEEIEDETDDSEVINDRLRNTTKTIKHEPDSIIKDIVKRGHKLFACSTQSGKTKTIQAAMLEAWEQEKGELDFWVLDLKGSNFLGIEKNPKRYLFVRGEEDIDRALEFVKKIEQVRRDRAEKRRENGGRWGSTKPRRLIFICEEFNNVLTIGDEAYRMADKEEQKEGNKAERIASMITLIVNLAREDEINVWITAQSHLVKAIKLSEQTKDNFDFFCLGRDGNYLSITRAITGRGAIVTDKRVREKLLDELNECVVVSVANIDPNDPNSIDPPVVFSTIGGYKMRVMPDLSGIENNRLFNPEKETQTA